jgi:hypothetical protein
LNQGDDAVLVAPIGNFPMELARMALRPSRFRAIPPNQGSYSGQSNEAELADLQHALKQWNVPMAERDAICNQHLVQRQKLAEFAEAQSVWEARHSGDATESLNTTDGVPVTRPVLTNVQVVVGLPPEFVDYFEGFIAWHNPAAPDKQVARESWEKLLRRPESERRYRSTWAAYMLGKAWEREDPEKAIGYFRQVRDLSREGYHDTLGLAAASLGLEARVQFSQTNYERAIELYLDQMSSGDPTATNSLMTAAGKALNAAPDKLQRLAKNPRTQKVLTAYVISRQRDNALCREVLGEGQSVGTPTQKWLDAVEAAGVRDLDAAEALALAAYRANDMETARRWIGRAANSPVAQWLRAKLLLRDGKITEAAALFARLSLEFPIIHEGTNAPASLDRKDVLTVGGTYGLENSVSAERQVQGELGVIRLARREYVQALDSLLNGGFWMDAAYVAERVLSLEELKSYVDRFWPAVPAEQIAQEQERWGDSGVCPARLREQIRYLLARRITRETHTEKAREYYPPAWAPAFDGLMAGWRDGWDESAAAHDRAGALFRAALITRTNGMELVGTEVAPDWHIHDGQFDCGVTGEERNGARAQVLRASEDELRRNAEHHPDPDLRFHYRYQAASLAWESAKLLPNNTDETAYVLWRGGSFLKRSDPYMADYFYKALVRRNRLTALGAEADRQRWFPKIDASGHIVAGTTAQLAQEQAAAIVPVNEVDPKPESGAAEIAEPALNESTPKNEFVLRKGDTLAIVLRACADSGLGLTIEDLLAANPGLDPARLRVGQKILIPARHE